MQKSTNNNRKYTINHHFFDVIDSEEKAYILGFILADGYNHGDYLRFNLKESDEKLLITIKTAISSDCLLYKYHHKNQPTWENVVTLSLNSVYLCNKLHSLGCDDNKSETLDWIKPNVIDHSLMRHFIRGYFDGDGSITIASKIYRCNLCSSKLFLEGLRNFLKEELGINICICVDKRVNGNYRIGYISGRFQIEKFMSYMYSNSKIYLHRKKLVADAIISNINCKNIANINK